MPDDYNQAAYSPNGLGSLDKESPLVEIISPGNIEADIEGLIAELDGSRSDEIRNYKNNLVPRLAIGWALINHLKLQDGLPSTGNKLARPREPETVFKGKTVKVEASYVHRIHALLVVDGVEIGKMIRDLLNLFLEQRRHDFPLERGYRVILAVGQGDKRGDYSNMNLGDPKHPWMLAKENAGNPVVTKFKKGIKTGEIDLDKTWARICIVDNLAREGINNPLCGVIGFAAPCNSQQEAAQRIGRILRSFIDDSKVNSGLLLVPPKSQDEIKIFLHNELIQGSRTLSSILAAIDYMVNMRDRLEGLTTVSDLIENEGGSGTGEMNTPNALNTKERVAIAYDLGEHIAAFPNISREEAIEGARSSIITLHYSDNPQKAQKANDWINQIRDNPDAASAKIQMVAAITPQDVVRRESRALTPENLPDEELVNWLRAYKPEHLAMTKHLHIPDIRKFLVSLYEDNYRLLERLPTKTNEEMEQDLDNARTNLTNLVVHKITDSNGNPYPPLNEMDVKKLRGLVRKRLNGAIRRKLIGNTNDGSVGRNSRYIQPQYVAVLRLENVQRELVGYTVRSILAEYCPQLRASMNWSHVHNEDDDAENLELDYGETAAQG
jgi:hypothetical protein